MMVVSRSLLVVALFPVYANRHGSVLCRPVRRFSPVIELMLTQRTDSFVVVMFSPVFTPYLVTFFLTLFDFVCYVGHKWDPVVGYGGSLLSVY